MRVIEMLAAWRQRKFDEVLREWLSFPLNMSKTQK
ncbi:hypothetical protein L288_00930 [Sphingobium quisquiliarum P25]|uniref:Uncharacterized protein n=1 Tax=Sphingobium quisquiliarum P25 TaxID=1329909 RepID=T0HRJ9_9SPHN|nr:hypothetical protein L288_00930 [Sphingobium quisquiliarum P25]